MKARKTAMMMMMMMMIMMMMMMIYLAEKAEVLMYESYVFYSDDSHEYVRN